MFTSVRVLRPSGGSGHGDEARPGGAPDERAAAPPAAAVRAVRAEAAGAVPIDRAVVARARSGDPRAFRVMFDRWAPAVRRFLRGVVRDTAAADEGTQECFVRAHRQLAGLREDDRIGPWLLGIARNVAFELLRLRRREQPASRGLTAAARAGGGGGVADSPDPAPSPEAQLLGSESDRVLEAALEALSAERRAALLLRIDHCLGYHEIAAAMGWTVPKVKNEIHRGRLELRDRLARYLGGEP